MTDMFDPDPGGAGVADVPGNAIPGMLGYLGRGPEVAPVGQQLPTDIVMASTLQRIERLLRIQQSATPQEGRLQSFMDGVNLSGGATAGRIEFEGPKSGADWKVERVAISASGASAAGTAALYQGSRGGAVPDEVFLLDFLNSFLGNTPSRNVFAPNFPYYIQGGAPLVVSFASVVANSAITARIQMREVQGQIDPELQNQT